MIFRDARKLVVVSAFVPFILLAPRIGISLRWSFSIVILVEVFQGFKLLSILIVESFHFDLDPPRISFGLAKFNDNFISLLFHLLDALLALFNEFILDKFVFMFHI